MSISRHADPPSLEPDIDMAAGLESPYAERLATWERKPEDEMRLTTRVECSRYFAVRDQALLAHATQIDPEGP